MKDRNLFLKVVSWRLVSILITLVVLWCLTNSVKEATGVTILLHSILTFSHYFFERVWDKINKEKK